MIKVLSLEEAKKWAEENLYESDSFMSPLNVAVKRGLLTPINTETFAVTDYEVDGLVWHLDQVHRLSDKEMQENDLYCRYRYKAHITNVPAGFQGVKTISAGLNIKDDQEKIDALCEMRLALMHLRTAWAECTSIFLDARIECNDYILGSEEDGDAYPFNESFDEVNVINWIDGCIERIGNIDIYTFAKHVILLMGGNDEDIEQIFDEIKESGYTTIDQVMAHLENYYT